jgi:hypothetical protein
MKIKLQILTFLFISLFAANTMAQTIGEYRSKASGNWSDATTWEKKNGDGSWTASAHPIGTSTNSHITIRSGHNVIIDGGYYCTNLVVEAGATLVTTDNGRELRIGAGTSPYSDDAFLINNGEIGTVFPNRLVIAPWSTIGKTFTFSGTGTTQIGALRVRGGNPNPIEIIIDQDMKIMQGGNIANFTLFDNTTNNKATDDYTLTLNAGKTVKIEANTPFHMPANTTIQAAGKYTYNIKGTLDLNYSGITRASHIFPFATASSKVVLNVSGKIIFGKEFNTINGSPSPAGTVALNINGGLIDATATTSLTMGSSYFKLDETGKVKRLVNATDTEFPIGTANSYNPAIINNTGTESMFTVGIKSTFDHPLSDLTKAVDKQWNITAETLGADATIKLGWLAKNEGSSFNNTSDIAIVNYNGAQWAGTLSTLTGSGTESDPRFATINNVTSYGIFGIQNYSSLPLKLLSFEVKSNSISGKNSADLKWTTSQEINTKEFLVERRTNENNFETIGVKNAVNKSGINYYSFFDDNIAIGTNYYRLKQVDLNGDFTYSNIISLDNTSDKLVSVYPNPVKNELTVEYGANKPAAISINSVNGAKVHSQSITESTTISLQHLKPGSYILSLNNGESNDVVKFIKE